MIHSNLGSQVINSTLEGEGVATLIRHLAFEQPQWVLLNSPRWPVLTQLTWGLGKGPVLAWLWICPYSFLLVPTFAKLIQNIQRKLFFIRKYLTHTFTYSLNNIYYYFHKHVLSTCHNLGITLVPGLQWWTLWAQTVLFMEHGVQSGGLTDKEH